MKTLGCILLSTTLIAGPVSAEEKTAAPSTLPATELTNSVNATTTEPVQLVQETQVESTQVQSQTMEKTEPAAASQEQAASILAQWLALPSHPRLRIVNRWIHYNK